MAKKFRKAWLMHTLPPSLLATLLITIPAAVVTMEERERERWELRSRPRPRSCATFCRSRPPTRHRLLLSQIWALRRRAPTTNPSTNVELMAKGIASESFLDLTDPSKTQDAETQLEAMMTIAKNTNAMQHNFNGGREHSAYPFCQCQSLE